MNYNLINKLEKHNLGCSHLPYVVFRSLTINKNDVKWYSLRALQKDKSKKISNTTSPCHTVQGLRRAIVIYGSNIGSNIDKGRFSLIVKNSIVLHIKPYSIIVGKLLSDGWLDKYSLNSNVRFKFKQSINRSDYVIYSWMGLSHYCSNIPYIVKSIRKGKISHGIEFSTRSLPCFNELHTLFYRNNKKVVPDNIYNILNPIALAHWIMGDGAILNKGLVLCTDSFTLQEVIRLRNVLNIKYNIDSTIQGWKNDRPRIYILQDSMPKLIKLVKPYILPSMLYKLHL